MAIRGNSLILDHGFGVYSIVVHLDRIDVVAGATVTAGQALGAIGSTGRSTGPHLHWEVIVGGVAVDPTVWTWRDFAGIRNGTGFRLFADSVEASPGAPVAPTPPATPPDTGPPSAGESGQPPDDTPAG